MLFLTLTAPLRAQQPLSFSDADLRGQTLFQQSAVTGMVLVVVRNREVMIRTYGETAPGSGHAPDSNSLIRLCSISKIFTTDLLLRLASEGKVSLTDPLQRYAPRGKHVPQTPGGNPITLLDLATHTAGLPREVGAYPRNIPHFTFPDHTLRWDWLPRQKLITPPGTVALYSNIGFDLLGDALATASGKSYARLLHERLLQPLGMWNTTLAPSREQCARLLQGVHDQGPCTDTQASGASGGLYATAADMAKFLQYLLHDSGSLAPPAADLAVSILPAQLKSVQGLNHAGDATGIGLAWIQLGDPASTSAIVQKTGGGAGFGTYIALNTARKTGIFLAVTDGRGDAQIDFYQEANNLLAALANVPPLPPRTRIRTRKAYSPRKHSRRSRQPSSHVHSKT
jgi:D-alanyl-D-alanine-carboxypeptidase/D-alanyl-D-alanine-endopeptidase